MMKRTPGNTVYTILNPEKKIPPTIIFTQKALKWIEALVEQHELEVGFLGLVEEDTDQYSFLVTDIFYPKHQAANGGTCEISTDGQTELMNWFIDKNRVEDINKLLLWGHSHHTMGVGPSGQDEKQALDMMQSSAHHIIRIIVNKQKLMSVSFFDYQKQVRFDNVAWRHSESGSEIENRLSLTKIRNIISSSSATENKLGAIEDVLSNDSEFQEIVEKTKLLKEKNIPSHYNNSNGENNLWPMGKLTQNSKTKSSKNKHSGCNRANNKDGKLMPYTISEDNVHQMNLLQEQLDQDAMYPNHENFNFIDDRSPELQEMMRIWEESSF